MFKSDVEFEKVGSLHPEQSEIAGPNGQQWAVVSIAPPVMKCSVCKGLLLADDTEAHAQWHVVNSIGLG